MQRLAHRNYRFLKTGLSALSEPAPSSRRKQPDGRARLAWGLAAFVLLLALTHVIVEAGGLRYHQSFRDPRMNKIAYYQAEVTHPGVVFLGNSQIHNGVIPEVVDRYLAPHGTDVGKSYNLGLGGTRIEIAYVVARDVLTDGKAPRILVVGISPGTLAMENRDRPMHRLGFCSTGDLLGHFLAGELKTGELHSVISRPGRILCNLRTNRSSLLNGDDYALPHVRRSRGGRWSAAQCATIHQMTPEQWHKKVYNRIKDDRKTPTFSDDSPQAAYLLKIQELAAARGMKLVLVYPPQHQDYTGKMIPKGAEDAYRAWITPFCQNRGIPYFDLNEPDRYEHADFGDPIHLNARGAEKFSRRISEIIAGIVPSGQTRLAVGE